MIKFGSSRVVINAAGVAVVKVMKPDISGFVRDTREILSGPRKTKALKMHWGLPSHSPVFLKGKLLYGYHANKREQRLAKQYPDTVVRTIGLLGIINIQPKLNHPNISLEEINDEFFDSMGGYPAAIKHELEDKENFGITPDDKFVFLDGGSQRLERKLEEDKDSLAEVLGNLALREKAHIQTPEQQG